MGFGYGAGAGVGFRTAGYVFGALGLGVDCTEPMIMLSFVIFVECQSYDIPRAFVHSPGFQGSKFS